LPQDDVLLIVWGCRRLVGCLPLYLIQYVRLDLWGWPRTTYHHHHEEKRQSSPLGCPGRGEHGPEEHVVLQGWLFDTKVRRRDIMIRQGSCHDLDIRSS